MRPLALAVILLASVCVGCSSATPSPAPSAPEETSSGSPPASPEPEAEPEDLDLAACDSVAGVVSPVQDAAEAILADSSGRTVDIAQLQAAVDVVAEARLEASPEF